MANVLRPILPLKHQDGISQLNVTLQTGRTHQIRRHAQMNGYPIIGDRKIRWRCQTACKSRLALHAHRLEFVPHPATDETIVVEAPVTSRFTGHFLIIDQNQCSPVSLSFERHLLTARWDH